jgi:hypothetical protein
MFATTEFTPVIAVAAHCAAGSHAPMHLYSALALQLPIGCRA